MSARYALITGSSGFLGRHFARALRESGWRITGIDLAAGRDARDFFRDGGPPPVREPDLVVHCAAVVGGREVIENSPLALAANLELDAALFRWALAARPGRIAYISSSAAYPVHLQETFMRYRLREDDIALDGPDAGNPDRLYGWAKLTGEKLAALARAAGIPVTVVRPFSGYGEDQDASYPFPAIAGRVLRREDPLTVWGSGAQARDFVHVDDIVATTLAMCEAGIDGPLNIGTGQPVTMAGLALAMARAAGYAPQIDPLPGTPAGVDWRVADVTALNAFRPARVTLDDGIARFFAGYMAGRPG
jgi:nucleoside-diphosphate-sugar epimerase